MHVYFLRSFFILTLLLFSSSLSFSQKTLADQEPYALYDKGFDLYQSKHFAAAQKVFQEVLEQDGLTNTMRAEATYYNAITAMELFQDDAEPLLLAFTEQYPEHPKARMMNYFLGKFYFREREYAKAAAAFENVDASDLNSKERYEYLFMAGYSYMRIDKYEEAKKYLRQVKDVPNDNMAIATYYYGYIAYEEGNYKEALSEFIRIKDDKKFQYIVPVYITQIYLLQNMPDKAIEYGEAALAQKETERINDIRLYLAEAYFKKGNFKKALENYAAYEGGMMTDNHYYQYGYALYQEGNYEEAIKNFNRVTIKEDTLGQNVSYHLGGAYVQTGEKLKARNAFEFASKLDHLPKIKEAAQFNYAKLSYEMGFEKVAIEELKKIIGRSPYSNEARELLGQILLAANNPREALAIFEDIEGLNTGRNDKLNEAYQKILYYYGLELFNNQQYSKAIEMFQKSLKSQYDKKVKALAFFWLGESQYKLGETDNAISNYKNFLYQEIARQTPYYDIAYYNLGYGYFKKEDYAKAKTYFQQYLSEMRGDKKSARYYDAVLRLADANFVLKNYDDAIKQYNEIIDARTSEPDYATYQLGMIQGIRNDYDNKISTMRSLARSYPKSPYIDDALFEVARTYMVRGNFPQAIKEYQSLNYNYPKNPYFRLALLNVGQSHINMGQDGQALSIFKNIIKLYPYSEEARQAMRGIQNSYIDRGLTDSLDAFLSSLPTNGLVVSSQDSVLYSSAYSNIKKNDCPAAIRAFETYLSKYPNGYFVTDANYHIATCAMQTSSFSKALKHYNSVIAHSPNPYMETSLKNGAELYYQEKDYEFALKRYQQLEEVAANKQNVPIALLGQIRSHWHLKEYEKVIDVSNKILNLGYTDEAAKTEALYYMGKSQFELNQTDQALATFTQVVSQSKAELGAEAMYLVATIQYLQEKYEEAENTIFEMKDKYAFYDYWRAKAFILLADIYVKLGDDFQAKSTLESIINNFEGDPEITRIAREKLEAIKERESSEN